MFPTEVLCRMTQRQWSKKNVYLVHRHISTGDLDR